MFCALLGPGERLQDHWSSGLGIAQFTVPGLNVI